MTLLRDHDFELRNATRGRSGSTSNLKCRKSEPGNTNTPTQNNVNVRMLTFTQQLYLTWTHLDVTGKHTKKLSCRFDEHFHVMSRTPHCQTSRSSTSRRLLRSSGTWHRQGWSPPREIGFSCSLGTCSYCTGFYWRGAKGQNIQQVGFPDGHPL
jgi:hypothetical protein